jgi:putative transcriptional regulator
VYAGHAGWGAGQLEDELDEGAWFVVDSEPGDGFRGDTETLWRDVLLRQTSTVALAATWRADPEVN